MKREFFRHDSFVKNIFLVSYKRYMKEIFIQK